jgi:hypothetical protein
VAATCDDVPSDPDVIIKNSSPSPAEDPEFVEVHPPQHRNECDGNKGVRDPVQSGPVLLFPRDDGEPPDRQHEEGNDDRHREGCIEQGWNSRIICAGLNRSAIAGEPWQQDNYKYKDDEDGTSGNPPCDTGRPGSVPNPLFFPSVLPPAPAGRDDTRLFQIYVSSPFSQELKEQTLRYNEPLQLTNVHTLIGPVDA